ncbi:hypothetical protein REC12_13400 [Desulfosporosinus sp. PR]|uniref:hypothetical protein n=1 Tax=Candidatus Desulfosporosinus nitrosoreducens TaxID=3401928 RepID=UPI0027F51690|nr:hypothetical protein [Desulfosporosinus sp. PR]MDQ7094586.1 hypothetical protein [Desulfosporosinus sp. PR]
MNRETFKFAFTENENGFTVTLQGDKESLRAKLEAFEAFLNFKEKARQAGFEHPDGSPIHQFFKAMHKHHAHHSGGRGPCGYSFNHEHHFRNSSERETPVQQNEDSKKTEE